MQPSQTTPLEVAARHMNNIKDAQLHALTVATQLVERLPFAALGFHVDQMRHNRSFEWGVLVRVHASNVALFAGLAVELGATQKTDVHSTGVGSVASYEVLSGTLAGVPFEISAYIGSQQIAVAA